MMLRNLAGVLGYVALTTVPATAQAVPLPLPKPDVAELPVKLNAPRPIAKPVLVLSLLQQPPRPRTKPEIVLNSAKLACAQISERLASVGARECMSLDLAHQARHRLKTSHSWSPTMRRQTLWYRMPGC